MSKPECKCLNCQDRTYACHSTCESYLSFRKDLDEYNDEVKKITLSLLAPTHNRKCPPVPSYKKIY